MIVNEEQAFLFHPKTVSFRLASLRIALITFFDFSNDVVINQKQIFK